MIVFPIIAWKYSINFKLFDIMLDNDNLQREKKVDLLYALWAHTGRE